MSIAGAVELINNAGALLVFPIDNRPLPHSLWSGFFPKSEMRWEWDSGGDNRVADLWHLKTELSTTGKVVYTKWYRGRATYFSKPLFVSLLRSLNPHLDDTYRNQATLSAPARAILEVLQSESPLSTKELKRLSDMRGKDRERIYEKALKELWSRLLIVAYGEVEDGAFPSLAVGATEALFENLWSQALDLDPARAQKQVSELLDSKNLFYKFYQQLLKQSPSAPAESVQKTKKSLRSAPITHKAKSVIDFNDL